MRQRLLALLSSLARPASLKSTAVAFPEEQARNQQFTVLGGVAQLCPVGLYRALRLLPLEAPPLLIKAQMASKTRPKVSLRTWASRRKTSSLQLVHSCPDPGQVWEWMALISPFSGSCGSLTYSQAAQGAMMFLVVIHPGVTPFGLSWTLAPHLGYSCLLFQNALCRVSCYYFNVSCTIRNIFQNRRSSLLST